MKQSKIILILVIVFLFLVKAWPIALVLLILLLAKKETADQNENPNGPTVEHLKKENEALRKELGEQAVRHAIVKADSRERDQ